MASTTNYRALPVIIKDIPNDNYQREAKPNKKEITILCFDLTHYNELTQFMLCCLGVFAFYLLYGYLQELIFTLDGFKPFGWYLTLVQFAYYTVFGCVERRLTDPSGKVSRCIPIRTYLLLAFLTLGTMGLSNSSLGYLNYPTQVIFKCCKLVPVLIGSILIQKKKHGPFDFLAAIAMCIGLTGFTLGKLVTTSINVAFALILIVCYSGFKNLAKFQHIRCDNDQHCAAVWRYYWQCAGEGYARSSSPK